MYRLRKTIRATSRLFAVLTRFELLKESGCIATLLATRRYSQPADIHHLTSGGRRRGDDFTISLSPWHHRGLKPAGVSTQAMIGKFGPSFAHGRREFASFFGSDDRLLKIQNVVLQMYEKSPWFDYCPPYEVYRAIREIR